jgi:hypothetical protein
MKDDDKYLIWCFAMVFLLGFGVGGAVIRTITNTW